MNIFQQGLTQYLTRQQIENLRNAKIGIGGAGGLGSTLAILLVRTGIEHLEVIDKDTIEASNLNRQAYVIDDIGKEKATVLKRNLLKINPDLRMTIHRLRWSLQNASNFFKNCSIVVEAFDGAQDKRDFVEYYQDKATYVIGASGVSGLSTQSLPAVQQAGNIFIVGDQESDVAAGHPPLAPRVTLCAAMMADIIIRLILQKPFGPIKK